MIKTWQQELAGGFSNSKVLCDYLHINPNNRLETSDFPMRVPYDFVDRMQKGCIDDPLLKQVLPVEAEHYLYTGFKADPVGDLEAMPETGVIHKYQGRVLLVMTGACAINCRYCFRRNFPYQTAQLSQQKIAKAIQYIQNNTTISEVILSGGDPLLLSDDKLFNVLQQLAVIEHVKRLRIHSRLPIVLPSRITTDFCQQLSQLSKPVVMVLHVNHVNELSNTVALACQKIRDKQITLLNQSVLLKGINDDVTQLMQLSEKLFTLGVLPYYLHLLDRATGTGHFEVSQAQAVSLMNQLKQQLSGYLVPKLVREQAGAKNKILII